MSRGWFLAHLSLLASKMGASSSSDIILATGEFDAQIISFSAEEIFHRWAASSEVLCWQPAEGRAELGPLFFDCSI